MQFSNSFIPLPKKLLLFFLVFSLALILNFIFGYIGHYGFDDMEYAGIASKISQGEFPSDNHFAYRFTIVVPTAICYLLFGVSDLSSSIPPLFAAISILFFITLFLKKESSKTLILALALTSLSPWFLRYSNMIMSDIYVCLGFVSAVYFLWKSQKENSNHQKIAVGFVASLLLGFMSKGTIVLILPLILVVFIFNMIQKKNWNFWKWTIIYGTIGLVLYFALIYLISGDPFGRFNAIGDNSYLNRCSYADQDRGILFRRISTDFFELMQRDHLLINFLLMLPTTLFLILKKKFKLDQKTHFMILSSIVLLISSNFMSISLKAYNPMCLDIRHYLYLIPISAITLSMVLNTYLSEKWVRWGMMLLVLLGLLISYRMDNPDFLLLSLPLSMAFLIYFVTYELSFKVNFIWLIIPLSLLIKPIDMALKAKELNYEGRRDFVIKELIEDREPKLILSDPVQTNLGNYFKGFGDDSLRFEDYRYFNPIEHLLPEKVYYLYNWHSAQQSFITNSQIPFYIKKVSLNEPIAKDDELAIAIYEVNDFKDIKQAENLFLEVVNDFEGSIDPWIQSADYLLKDPKDGSNQISRIGEYSSTFQMEIDSMIKVKEKIFISAAVKILSNRTTDAKLILSFENENGSVLYESEEIDPFLRSYSNWWEVQLEKAIDSKVLRESSLVKIYVWNVSKGELFMDDFSVKFYSMID